MYNMGVKNVPYSLHMNNTGKADDDDDVDRQILNKQYPLGLTVSCFDRGNNSKSKDTQHPKCEVTTKKGKYYNLKIGFTQATLLAQGQTCLLSAVQDERKILNGVWMYIATMNKIT